MVQHVILWQLKDELTEIERTTAKMEIKRALEALQEKVPSLLKIKVYTTPLASSNAEVMLVCEFKDEAGLQEYAKHPDHVAAATQSVRPYIKTRLCFDTAE